MPWCPKCKSEFREGFTKCSDCNIDLVEMLEGNQDNKSKEISNMVLLITANDDYEAQIAESVLESNNIKYDKSVTEFGDYSEDDTDTNNTNISFYVSENDYEFAQKLLESRIDALVEDLENGEDDSDTENNAPLETAEKIKGFEDEDNGERKNNIILKIAVWVLIIILAVTAYQYLQ